MSVKILYVPVGWTHNPMTLQLLKQEGRLEEFEAALDKETAEACAELDIHLSAGWKIVAEHLLELSRGSKVVFVLHRLVDEGELLAPPSVERLIETVAEEQLRAILDQTAR